MNETFDFETRKEILHYITNNPGVHLSNIAETLNKNITIVELYLRDMEQKQMIVVVEKDGVRRYYIPERPMGIRDKRTTHTRSQIYTIIENNPGIYMSKIADYLHVRISLVEYHLQQMERNKEIIGVRESGYHRRYYIPRDVVGLEERKILSLLRQEIPLKIVLYLLKHPNSKHKDILTLFDITSSTLSYHLNKLVKEGILDIPSYTEDKGYNIRNKQVILKILNRYKLFTLTHTFKRMWEDLNYKS